MEVDLVIVPITHATCCEELTSFNALLHYPPIIINVKGKARPILRENPGS
jgi:hypothetical protein